MTSGFSVLMGTCALAAGQALMAATPPPEDVVVTATRTRTPADQLAVPVIVIDRAAIEASLAPDAAELLAGQAGIELARNGGPGQLASLFLRGTDSNHTTVLIDGVRINPGTIGSAPIQNVLPESLERIEVVKGPRSTLYGSDAIGGVVNLITRSGAARGLTVSSALGRYGTRSASVDTGFDLGERASFGGDLAWRAADGFAPLAGYSIARGYRNLSGDARLSFKPDERTRLGLHLWQASGNTQYLGYDDAFVFGPVDQDYHNQLLAADALWQGGRWQLAATLSHLLDDLRQNQSPDRTRTRRDTLDLQALVDTGGQRLTLGAVLDREHTDSLSFGTAFDVSRHGELYFAQSQRRLGPGSLLLAAGSVQDSAFGSHPNWNAEYALPLSGGWQLNLAAGNGYHAPDSTDLYGYGGNPQLRAERSRQVELGLVRSWSARSTDLAQHASVQAYDNRLRDLIVLQPIDPASYQYQNANVERARIRGVELGYGVVANDWRLEANLSLQEPRNESTGQALLRRARAYGSIDIGRRVGIWSLDARLRASGTRLDYGFPDIVRLAPYRLLDLAANAGFGRLELGLRLDNAGDQRYELASGYNTPGRSLTVAARYHLR